jgi:hypothetical protein
MLRRFVIAASVNGNEGRLQWLRQIAEESHPDGILYPGDIRNPGPGRWLPEGRAGLARDEGRFYEHFFLTLGRLARFTAIVLGPADVPLHTFLRLGMNAEVEFPNLHLAHAASCDQGDAVITGMGGQLTDS